MEWTKIKVVRTLLRMFLENLKIVEFPESQPFGNWQQKMVKNTSIHLPLEAGLAPGNYGKAFSFATGFPEIKTEYFV